MHYICVLIFENGFLTLKEMSRTDALRGCISFLLYLVNACTVWRMTDLAQVLAKCTDSVWVALKGNSPSCPLPTWCRLDQPLRGTPWQHPIKWNTCPLKNGGGLIAKNGPNSIPTPTSIHILCNVTCHSSYQEVDFSSHPLNLGGLVTCFGQQNGANMMVSQF